MDCIGGLRSARASVGGGQKKAWYDLHSPPPVGLERLGSVLRNAGLLGLRPINRSKSQWFVGQGLLLGCTNIGLMGFTESRNFADDCLAAGIYVDHYIIAI